MSDSQVTAPKDEHRKIRISGVAATNHTNPPEILAQIGSQRGRQASSPGLDAGPPLNDPSIGKAGSVNLSAQEAASRKLLLTVAEAAARLGIGRTLMYELISTGAVASVQVGRLRRIRPADLESYTANLAPVGAAPSIAA